MPQMVLVFLLCAMGCAGFPSDPDGLRKWADDLEGKRVLYEKVEDKWGSGDVASSFTAYLEENHVHLIEEQMTRGQFGHSMNRYYFYNDRLFCYREKRTNPDSTVVDIEILFDPEGQVLVATQSLNGSPTALESYIAPMAQKHGQTLRDMTKRSI